MSEYDNFPPHSLLISVLKSNPQSALLYIDLWKIKDDDFSIKIQKHDMRSQFLMSPTMFRNKLMPLVFNGLLRINEFGEYYLVELVGDDFDLPDDDEA